jgi:hypothetical protein
MNDIVCNAIIKIQKEIEIICKEIEACEAFGGDVEPIWDRVEAQEARIQRISNWNLHRRGGYDSFRSIR